MRLKNFILFAVMAMSIQLSVGQTSVSIAVDSNVTGCFGNSNAGLTAVASNGTLPYTYLWSNTATTASITGISAGTYSVVVADSTGAMDTASVTVTQPNALSANTAVATTPACNGDTTGSAIVSGSGGTTPFSYLWSNGQTSSIASNLGGGTYMVTITDANGCTDSSSVLISEPAALVATASVDSNVTTVGGSNGGASASVLGGTASYTYVWSNGATTPAITGLAAGTYTITVTDQNGCTDSSAATISQVIATSVSVASVGSINCNGDTTGIVATASGTAPFTYVWSTGDSTMAIYGVGADTYSITITDGGGLMDSATIIITEPAVLNAGITINNTSACIGPISGSILSNPSGGTAPYAYSWSTGATSSSLAGLSADTFNITVTDANGCSSTQEAIVRDADPVAVSITTTRISCGGSNDGSLRANPLRGAGPYSYQWSNGDSVQIISNLSPGNFAVTVTDGRGCTVISDTVSLVLRPATSITLSKVDKLCENNNNGQASVIATGDTAFSYSWSTNSNDSAIVGLSAATYTVTVTADNGCTATDSIAVAEGEAPYTIDIGPDTTVCGNTFQLTGPAGFAGYLWSDGRTTQDIVIFNTGTYTLVTTNGTGCTASDEAIVVKEACVGVEEVNGVASAVVFPNPVRNNAMIQMDGLTSEEVIVQVVDLQGRMISNEVVSSTGGSIEYEILSQSWRSGVYLITLKDGQESHTHRLLKE